MRRRRSPHPVGEAARSAGEGVRPPLMKGCPPHTLTLTLSHGVREHDANGAGGGAARDN
jgi:hypothetical protein